MHYGDKKQLKSSTLEIVVYKHEVLSNFKSKALKINKNGVTSKRCVDYEIASIQKCKHFNPRVLRSILKDPYKHLSKALEKAKYEEWLLVKIYDTSGYGDLRIIPVMNVSEHKNDFLRLH